MSLSNNTGGEPQHEEEGDRNVVALTLENGSVYRGEVNLDNVPHGCGVVELDGGGSKLEGTWRDGRPHGTFKLRTDSCVSTVEFTDGDAANTGTVTYSDGRFYAGEMKDWVAEGIGVLCLPHGAEMHGSFFDDKVHGLAVMKMADGSELRGNWHMGLAQGPFRLTMTSTVINVEFVNGVASRSGTVTYSDGRWYKGEIEGFNAHGKGVLIAEDGSWEYCGEFAADKRWGNGVHRYVGDQSPNSVYAGGWQEDQKHGHGIEGNGVEGNIAAAVLYEKGKLLSSTPVVPLTLEEEWHLAWQLYRDATAPDFSAPVDGIMEEYLENVKRDVLGPMLTALTAREAELAASRGASGRALKSVRHALDRVKELAPQRDDIQTYLQAVRWATSLHEQEQNVGRATGTYRMIDGGQYKGSLHDGIPHGSGVLTHPDGKIHRGEFADGEAHGPGVVECHADHTMKGVWCHGKAHGPMQHTTSDTETYFECVNGVPDSTGTVLYKDGRRYHGELRDGVAQGTGEIRYPDGRVYRGECSADGLPHHEETAPHHSHGVLQFPNGTQLEGRWRHGKFHGPFRVTIGEDCTIQLEYDNGAPSRKGTVTYHCDGSCYEGDLNDWVPHGQGSLTYSDGRVHCGEFADENPHGPGVVTYPDHGTVEGVWREGEMHGLFHITASSVTCELEYVEGIAALTGTLTYRDGRHYQGDVKDGIPHGTGELTYPDGRVYRGQFASGEPLGAALHGGR